MNQTQDPYLIMNNLSSTYQILKETQDQDSFSFLAPVRPPLDIDYSASTLAASSACEPYSRQCNLRLAGDYISSVFNCSDNFNGANPGVSNSNISIPDWPNCGDWGCIYLFSDAGLNNTDSLNKSNPFYAGVQGHIRQHQLDWQQTLAHDPEILSAFWQYYFILRCEIRIHNLTYSWVNGSMASKTLALVNNSDVLEVSSWLLEEGIVADQLAYMLQLATVIGNTSQKIADYYAAQLEMVTLAASAGFFQPKLNMKEQVRRPVLVTRVPKAPLFFLWSLCILYVLLGLGLAVSITATHPAAYRDVQARLSIFGLVASRFESGAGKRVTEIGDLFEERTGTSSVHVGIVKTEEGGWNYASEGC